MLNIKQALNVTASVATISICSLWAPNSLAADLEKDRYNLRLITQIFNGNQEFSHTQTAGFARIRNGDQSYVQLDFHDGAVAVDKNNALSVTKFKNLSGQEAAFLYDFKTHTMSAENDVAQDFNRYIRPLMQGNTIPGVDAAWTRQISIDRIGLEQSVSGQVNMELSRSYFTHKGQDYVLVNYKIPAFEYKAPDGTPVIHWGQSSALLDAKMAKAYWNVSLHRATAGDDLQQTRPYRYLKTIAMSDDNGNPVIDIREIPQVWEEFSDYYTEDVSAPIPFSSAEFAGDFPVSLAVKLDSVGLSLAENSGNQLGEVSEQSQSGNRGKEVLDDVSTGVGNVGRGAAVVKNTLLQGQPSRSYVVAKKNNLQSDWASYTRKSEAFAKTITLAEREARVAGLAATTAYDQLENLQNVQSAALSRLSSIVLPGVNPQNIKEYQKLSNEIFERGKELESLENIAQQFQKDSILKTTAVGRLEKDYDALKLTGDKLAHSIAEVAVEAEISGNADVIRGSFIDRLPSPLKNAINSSTAKFVAQVADNSIALAGDASNLYTTIKSGVNVLNASTTNQGSGGVALVRNYSAKGLLIDLPFDIGGLALNAAAGDIRGFASDGIALTSSVLADLFVTTKAAGDTRDIKWDAIRQTNKLLAAQYDQEVLSFHDNKIASAELIEKINASDLSRADKEALISDISKLDAVSSQTTSRLNEIEARFNKFKADEATAAAKSDDDSSPENRKKLDERLEEDSEDFWEKYNEEQRLKEEADNQTIPTGGGGSSTKKVKVIEPSLGDGPDYPTAEPRDNSEDDDEKAAGGGSKPATSAGGEGTSAAAAATASIPASGGAGENSSDPFSDWQDPYADFDLDAYQKEKLEERKKAVDDWWDSLHKEAQGEVIGAGVRYLEDSDALLFGDYDIRHFIFTSVDFTAPEFKLPEWVPVEWKPVEFSGFDFTNFDDEDWPGGEDNISLTFATDTTKWDDWIDSIGRRKLERLAKTAGFYTIAEALKNWNLILKNYNDPDWVRWALNPPGCSPTQGCGGASFQGRWAEGLAQLELGRLISQSRDLFSTAGLSDIAIFGFDLEYVLRDFGLEDGDLVEIVIEQFGRELFRQELSLLNIGTEFDIRLGPGVSSLTITALNEGAISPNTAEINIENVAEGESNQTYSLLEGEQAILRVETGR